MMIYDHAILESAHPPLKKKNYELLQPYHSYTTKLDDFMIAAYSPATGTWPILLSSRPPATDWWVVSGQLERKAGSFPPTAAPTVAWPNGYRGYGGYGAGPLQLSFTATYSYVTRL